MKECIPDKILSSKNDGKSYALNYYDDGLYLCLGYNVDTHNQTGIVGNRCFSKTIPKYISRNIETFEVIGLLQAEMGKQQDGRISFCNHEHRLVNKVIKWFEKEFEFQKKNWKWVIKVNIQEPISEEYKVKVENKVISHWVAKTIPLNQAYPKKVSYIKNTQNTVLGFYDYGNLIIEHKDNLFSHIVKILVKQITSNITKYSEDEIRAYMRGIIAGEGCIEIDMPIKKFRVRITATEKKERELFMNCLAKINIESKNYEGGKDIIISRKENILELLKQRLMTLSPEKYNKFLRMMNLYGNFDKLKEWRENLPKPHNKIPQMSISKVIDLHNQHPDWPAWKIAELVGISDIKVQRVRKELSQKEA
jgi:hypothetical protein